MNPEIIIAYVLGFLTPITFYIYLLRSRRDEVSETRKAVRIINFIKEGK